MRKLLKILCSLLVLAILLGKAQSEHPLNESAVLEAKAVHAVNMVYTYHCVGEATHGGCHILLANQVTLPLLRAGLASSQGEIVPVRANSYLSSPQPPPPRHVS